MTTLSSTWKKYVSILPVALVGISGTAGGVADQKICNDNRANIDRNIKDLLSKSDNAAATGIKDARKRYLSVMTAGAVSDLADANDPEAEVNALSKSPAPSFPQMLEGAVYNRAKGELAYAAFYHFQELAPVALQDAFLKNAKQVMASPDDSQAGTLFASALSSALQADMRAFPDKLKTYLTTEADDQTLPETTRNRVQALAFILPMIMPENGKDPIEAMANLMSISGDVDALKLKANWEALSGVQRAIFAVGVVAEIWRYEKMVATKQGAPPLTNTDSQWPDMAIQLLGKTINKTFSKADTASLKALAQELLNKIEALRSTLDQLKSGTTAQGVLDLRDGLSNCFKTFEGFADILVPKLKPDDPNYGQYLHDRQDVQYVAQVIDHFLHAYAAYINKDYGQICADFALVSDQTLALWYSEKVGDLAKAVALAKKNAMESNTAEDKKLAAVAEKAQADFPSEFNKINTSLSDFLRWAKVGASLASATTQDDFDQVIDSVSEPISSYRNYRKVSTWYINAKAYLGLAAGVERQGGHSPNYASAFVPVGLEGGYSTNWTGMSYIGFLVSPVDVGAITATRFNSSTNTNAPTLKDIVAPGFFLTFGISKNWPLTLGTGYQYAPRRSTDPQSGAAIPANRILIFAAVDIPFLGRLWH